MDRPMLRFWGETDGLGLTLFSAADFIEFSMDPNGLNGVQAKDFVRDRGGTAWLLKSGALGDEGTTRWSPEDEKTRRAALPVHEAIVAMIQRSVNVGAGDVDFAFRTLPAVDEPKPLRLLVSAHRLLHGRRRDKIEFQPSAHFVVDLFLALCVNVAVGQVDHEPHNYLVAHDGRFLPIDNSRCMYGDWLTTDLTSQQFDNIRSIESTVPTWTDALRVCVQRRLKPLTTKVVESIFAALPPEVIDWHDSAAGNGYYTPGTLAQKQVRVKKNVEALRHWAGSDLSG